MSALSFNVIEVCALSILRQREQHYMDTLQPTCNIERTVGKGLAEKWRDPAFRDRNQKRCAEQSTARAADPDFRKQSAERMKLLNTEDFRAAASKRLAERWKNDSAFIAAAAARGSMQFTKLFADPECRKRHSERQSALMKQRMNTPEAKFKQSARFKGVNKRPMYCITTGEYFPSVGDAAAAKGVSVSVVNKQCRSLPTRSALQWRYLTDQELIERGYDPSKVRRDMPADRMQA